MFDVVKEQKLLMDRCVNHVASSFIKLELVVVAVVVIVNIKTKNENLKRDNFQVSNKSHLNKFNNHLNMNTQIAETGTSWLI